MAEFFYTVSDGLHRMARKEGKKVVELDFEIASKSVSLLDGIFLGRVVEIQTPLQAAFVDIGREKPGLLPLKEGKLIRVNQGDAILVQVNRTENPLEEKGVRLTRLITLSLGPLLYTPFRPGLNFSKKLKEREAFNSFLPLTPEEGVVIRSWAKPDKILTKQLTQLREEWGAIQKQASKKPPLCLSPPPSLLLRMLRSLNPADGFRIDDRMLASQTKGVAIYTKEKAFDELCEEAWDSLFSPEVPFSQGGSLYIEETRGLTVIDVNSQGALRHSLPFNRIAIGEAVHQIHLRDLGGKIVVDLIDAPKNLKPLLQGLDIPSDTEIFGLSSMMGLLEMIRRRRRLSLSNRLRLQIN